MKTLDRPLLIILIFSIIVSVGWCIYVGFIRDDAFITFRYSQNLANGHGLVYNLGERVQGMSSPGFAILMAAWLFAFPDLPVAGALLFDILAWTLCLVLMWQILKDAGFPETTRIYVLVILIISDRVLVRVMEGMEIPFVLLGMLASFYLMTKDRAALAGAAAGAMLWFRLDAIPWIPVLVVVFWLSQRRNVLIFLSVAVLVYLPWAVFAEMYYGNFMPLTVIAKRIAYSLGAAPIHGRIDVLLGELSPFSMLDLPAIVTRIFAVITFLLAGYGAWKNRRSPIVQVLALFVLIQAPALVLFNMTVEQRYITTLLITLMVLFAIGLQAVITSQRWAMITLGIYAIAALVLMWPRVEHVRDYQLYVYEGSLQEMGQWLNYRSAGDSAVFLEPLGYVGYYSNRFMWDEVGIVTPLIVPLKAARLNPFQIAALLEPEYVIFHCDDARRAPEGFGYELAVRFDPLDFEGGETWHDPGVQRNACYEIHQRQSMPGKG